MTLAWDKSNGQPYIRSSCGRYTVTYADMGDGTGAFTAVRMGKDLNLGTIIDIERAVPKGDEDKRAAARAAMMRACERDASSRDVAPGAAPGSP